MTDPTRVYLLVEDSEHDIMAFKRAWRENAIADDLHVVRDGQECLDYLHGRGRYSGEADAPQPAVILLNNRLPKMEGLSVLEKIRQNADFAYIPVIIFTSGNSELKEMKSYDTGANAYVVKPMKYEDLSQFVRRMNKFWELVEVPEKSR